MEGKAEQWEKREKKNAQQLTQVHPLRRDGGEERLARNISGKEKPA